MHLKVQTIAAIMLISGMVAACGGASKQAAPKEPSKQVMDSIEMLTQKSEQLQLKSEEINAKLDSILNKL